MVQGSFRNRISSHIKSYQDLINHLFDLKQLLQKLFCKGSKIQQILYFNCGVPEGLKLDQLHFNVGICDYYLLDNTCDIASYADDYTPDTSDVVIKSL